MVPLHFYHEKNLEQEFCRFLCNSATMNNLIEDLPNWHGVQKQRRIEALLQYLETPGIHQYYLRREDAHDQHERIVRLRDNLQNLQDMLKDANDKRFVSEFTRSVMGCVYH